MTPPPVSTALFSFLGFITVLFSNCYVVYVFNRSLSLNILPFVYIYFWNFKKIFRCFCQFLSFPLSLSFLFFLGNFSISHELSGLFHHCGDALYLLQVLYPYFLKCLASFLLYTLVLRSTSSKGFMHRTGIKKKKTFLFETFIVTINSLGMEFQAGNTFSWENWEHGSRVFWLPVKKSHTILIPILLCDLFLFSHPHLNLE